MARSIWSGAISFGLVNIPIRLYSAISQKEVRFHMLHGKDGGRIQFKRACSVDGQEVPYEEIVKGYEIARGNYVVIDPQELERLDPKATRTVEIEDFVALSEIDPIFYEHWYHVAPDRGAGRAYALLLQAMERKQKVGIARMVMRTKGYLCALRPAGGALMLSTLLYADEVVPVENLEAELPDRDVAPRGKELEMAEQLIEVLSGKFEPEKYRDEYRDKVLQLIEKKAEGQEIVAPPEAPPEARVVNLADALAASLAAGRRRGNGGRTERRAPREEAVSAKKATKRPKRKSS